MEWGLTVKFLLEKTTTLPCLTYELIQLAMSVIPRTTLIKTVKKSFFKTGVFRERTNGYFDTGELSQNTINLLTAAKVFPFVGLVSCWSYTPQANCGYQLRYVIIHPILLSHIDKKTFVVIIKGGCIGAGIAKKDKISLAHRGADSLPGSQVLDTMWITAWKWCVHYVMVERWWIKGLFFSPSSCG